VATSQESAEFRLIVSTSMLLVSLYSSPAPSSTDTQLFAGSWLTPPRRRKNHRGRDACRHDHRGVRGAHMPLRLARLTHRLSAWFNQNGPWDGLCFSKASMDAESRRAAISSAWREGYATAIFLVTPLYGDVRLNRAARQSRCLCGFTCIAPTVATIRTLFGVFSTALIHSSAPRRHRAEVHWCCPAYWHGR